MKLEELFEGLEGASRRTTMDSLREHGIDTFVYVRRDGVRIGPINFSDIEIQMEEGLFDMWYKIRKELRNHDIPEDVMFELQEKAMIKENSPQAIALDDEVHELSLIFRSLLQATAVKFAETQKKHYLDFINHELPEIQKRYPLKDDQKTIT